MALICSISNEVPEDPVLSPVSNHIFERRLIEKYLEENHTDPMNGEPLEPSNLIEVKTNPLIRPRPPTATSIPAILKLLQDEWDACMLQTFTLRQHLHTTRQELSHVLYQHDAACRVIARITRENNELRETLATIKPITVGPQHGIGVGVVHEGAASLGPLGIPMETGDQPADSVTALPPLVSSCLYSYSYILRVIGTPVNGNNSRNILSQYTVKTRVYRSRINLATLAYRM